MQVSAEIRWFWHRAPPVGLEAWFCTADFHGCPAGGGALRVDEYLRDTSQVELGLKRRGGKKGIEVKGLVAIAAKRLAVEPYTGPVELWTKWTSETLELDTQATVKTEKQRWLRKFATATKTVREVPVDSEEKTFLSAGLDGCKKRCHCVGNSCRKLNIHSDGVLVPLRRAPLN